MVAVFGVLEYGMFGGLLGLSVLIGIYFGFFKGGQNTVDGYLLGGKEMGILPIAVSLTSSFISGVTLLGIPAEIYTYGVQYFVTNLCFFSVTIINFYFFLPVFYELQAPSVYEYMERRFCKKVRKLASFLFAVSLLSYIPTVIYGAALAFNQVSGVDIHMISLVVCIVCIFYTSFGGLKAVVWADTLQGSITHLATLVVAIIGTIKAGGISPMIEAIREGDRIDLFEFDLDPTLRLSFWTLTIGQTVAWTSIFTISPSAVQRFVALNSMSKAKKTVVLYTIGCLSLSFLSGYIGIIIYTQFKGCDPLTSGHITRGDQILPFFILETLGHISGLPGIFLAGIVSAALSTMSGGLNSVSGTLYEDFIEPTFGKTTEFRASLIMKALVLAFGVICTLLVMVIEKFGSLIELSVMLGGLTSGPILGVFILGLFFPQANSIGALVGGGSSMGIMTWILFGSQTAIANGDISFPAKPIRVDQCPFNVTSINQTPAETQVSDEVFPLFKMSIFYFTVFGCAITVVFGLIASYLSGPNPPVDRALLTPFVRRMYEPVPTKEPSSKKTGSQRKDSCTEEIKMNGNSGSKV